MTKIVYQELDIPVESKISSFAEEIQENCELLFYKYNIFDETKKSEFHEQKITTFPTRVYNYASKEILQIVSNFLAWTFVFDDYIETHHYDRDETCERVLQIGYGNLSLKEGEALRSLEALFSEIWNSIKKQSPNEWQKRFIDSIRNWFVFTNILMKHKMNGTIPTMAEFISYRWFDAASDMAINLIEFAMEKFLPQSFHNEMVIQHLVHANGNVIGAINDIFSYEKDIRADNNLNFVEVMKNEMKIEVQEAIDRRYDFTRAQIQSYFLLRKQLNRIFDPNDEVIKKYVDGMDSLMRGHYDFYFDGNRYFEICPFKSDSRMLTNSNDFEF
ncbi:terpene synthase-like protein [Dinothrombium tinctorium]|uniref:Terpene synthase n=1 Tax=Dinothrombium tinctorium TaxID=1965070 RepID=A0A443QMV3_9ACAR|nr:terpene synthase-like protein [Dinothrombium tinctorium]